MKNKFYEYLSNDMNIPNGITYLLDLVKEINQSLRVKDKDLNEISSLYYAIKEVLYILGLSFDLKVLSDEDKILYHKYEEAKANKDFETSDKIREELIQRKIL